MPLTGSTFIAVSASLGQLALITSSHIIILSSAIDPFDLSFYHSARQQMHLTGSKCDQTWPCMPLLQYLVCNECQLFDRVVGRCIAIFLNCNAGESLLEQVAGKLWKSFATIMC